MQYITVMVADGVDLSGFPTPGDDPYSGEPLVVTGVNNGISFDGNVLMVARGPNPLSPATEPVAHTHTLVAGGTVDVAGNTGGPITQ